MYVNNSGKRLVIGRFHVAPGDPVPGIPLTEAEQKGVDAFVKAGYLVEYRPVGQVAKVETKTEPKVEAKVEAKPEAKVEVKAEAKVEAEVEAKVEAEATADDAKNSSSRRNRKKSSSDTEAAETTEA